MPVPKRCRFSREDWALIREALDMLQTNYPEEDGNHPEQARLDRLCGLVEVRAYHAAPSKREPGHNSED
jgi:hypothetical protein